MKTYALIFFLTNLILAGVGRGQVVDSDGDGIPNAWETSMGLNPNDAGDAFADKDGDRIPNLWEYARGTLANNATSVPSYDAIVDGSLPSDPSSSRYATLQEAYDSLSSVTSYRSLVYVKRGNYAAVLDGSGAPKKVAWIGELGPDRTTGFEGVVLRSSWLLPATGLLFTDDTVLDGIIIDGDAGVAGAYPAIVMQPDPSVAVLVPEMRMINCIVRNWRFANWVGVNYPYSNILCGAFLNLGGEVWFVHCTFWQASSYNSASGQYAEISNNTGIIKAINSILWDDQLYSQQTPAVVGIPAALINHCVLNSPNLSPFLTHGGHIYSNSNGVLGTAVAYGITRDIQGEPRPATAASGAAGIDIGADERIDSDADNLPDWWEKFWFGNLTHTSLEVFNGSRFFDLCIGGYRPTDDQDGDGLPDSWELTYFPNIGSQGPLGNPDGDERNNFQEWEARSDPTVVDTDSDADLDGLLDVWEIQHFGSITLYSGSDDPDHDGATNLEEQTMGTDPVVWDDFSIYDGNGNGLPDLQELRMAGNLDSNDVDGDGLSNALELAIGSDPFNRDTNGDGIPDGLAWLLGIQVVVNPVGSILDSDGDGISDADEILNGTNPFAQDTDGDGIDDLHDPLPLDSSWNSATPPPDLPGSPVIFMLISPPGAVPVP